MIPAMAMLIDSCERGWVPDPVVRLGIRRLLAMRRAEISADDVEQGAVLAEQFVASMRDAPVAIDTALANEQHYEVPSEFFTHVLGRHRKYSCGYWAPQAVSLDESEAAALALTCEHAQLQDGQRVLELGCGWGSLTLWMAEHYPASRIVAVSNSHSQRQYIEAAARERGIGNVQVITADMNGFDPGARFDRVVSVEMFEHMRNWGELFRRIAHWLEPDGRLFLHVFAHRAVPYAFVPSDPSDWMSRHFFSGGMMPSDDLPLRLAEVLVPVERWRWSGQHYEKTANAWLARMDSARDVVLPLFAQTYGKEHAERWFARWRIFFMAVAEMFGYRHGQEWWVSHYLLERSRINSR